MRKLSTDVFDQVKNVKVLPEGGGFNEREKENIRQQMARLREDMD